MLQKLLVRKVRKNTTLIVGKSGQETKNQNQNKKKEHYFN